MTDKIIIDEVNVYECEHYIRGECTAKYYLENGYEIRNFFDCEKFPNCYYKQLQRKTAECEELNRKLNNEKIADKSEIEIFNQTCLDLQEELKESISKFEELKIKLMQKDEVNAFFNIPIEGWSSDPCAICESKNEYQRYKQVLEEIEEYCKKHIKMRLKNCHYQYTNNSRILVPIKKILDKAKEAENDR